MNTALKIYPNTRFELLVREEAYHILWEADTDQVLVKKGDSDAIRRLKKAASEANVIDFVTDPEERRADATYGLSVENNRLRLKYMDGHRFQSIIMQ